MAQSWLVDPKTGDYVMDGGKPIQTDSLKVPAYFRLKIPRLKWLYAPNQQYGSDIYTLKKRDPHAVSQAERFSAKALQPLADDGRAVSIDVTAKQASRYGIGLQADITEATGKEEQLTLPSLGV